jgi:hypothetical protein
MTQVGQWPHLRGDTDSCLVIPNYLLPIVLSPSSQLFFHMNPTFFPGQILPTTLTNDQSYYFITQLVDMKVFVCQNLPALEGFLYAKLGQNLLGN